MNGKYREAKTKSRSRFYILLSIIFVVVLFKWGIPAFINAITGPSTKGSQTTGQKDVVPPQIPAISALPEATNSAKIKVEGFTEATVDTELYLNDVLVSTQKSDGNGAFVLEGVLDSGDNRVLVMAKDPAGNKSQSEVIMINYDNKPVELEVSTPKDGSEYFGKNNQTIDVKGLVNKKDATVIVNGSYSMVDKDGNFSQRILLNSGDNNITVKASDKAGNTAEKTFKIVYNP